MTFTRHGHHIVGTPVSGKQPEGRARCGGIVGCAECAKDAAQAIHEELSKPDPELPKP